ncbi:MAG: hypothetical protein K6T85_00140 [Gorillibacterium sp.]|nr:hypothetical protein [Gorillibacterium sp.]
MRTIFRKKMIRPSSAVLWMILILFMGTAFLKAGTAAAEPSKLAITIQAGYDGYAKEGRFAPVVFTLENLSSDMSGDLVVTSVSPTAGNDVTYIKHLELPKGSTKVVSMALPGISYTSKNNKVEFYKGSYTKGNAVSLAGKAYITLGLKTNSLVGGLTRDPDTLNFLSLVGGTTSSVSPVSLATAALPDDSMLLDGLDALVINDVATDTLSDVQIQAITDWVRGGGTLILAGGPQYAKTAKAFEQLAPLIYEGTAQVTKLSALEQETGKPLKLSDPVSLATGRIQDGQVILAQDGVPLLVKRALGAGTVYSIAYDIADPSLSAWNGNAALWQGILGSKANPNNNINSGAWMNSLYAIDNALNLFPSIHPPKFKTLSLLFIFYIIIVAPLLYFILKKLDKREWAWGIIPLIAILSTAVIYMVGASDKSSTLSHELNRYVLDGSGQGKQLAYTAVFVPRGGTVTVSLPAKAQAIPFDTANGIGSPTNELKGNADTLLYDDVDKLRIQWQDVPFWSVRKTKWQQASLNDLGQFTANAVVNGSKLEGDVTNGTKTALTTVHIIANNQLIPIGDLAAGEAKSFSVNLSPISGRYSGDLANQMFVQSGSNTYNQKERERQMLTSYIDERNLSGQNNLPFLIGWSKDTRSDIKINGKTAKTDRLNMWVQDIAFTTVKDGNISLPFGYVIPTITEHNATNYLEEGNGFLNFGGGTITLEYKLPIESTISFNSLSVRLPDNAPIILEIWNFTTESFEPVSLGSVLWKVDKNSEHYISKQKIVRLKTSTTQPVNIRYPEISLEGTVTP